MRRNRLGDSFAVALAASYLTCGCANPQSMPSPIPSVTPSASSKTSTPTPSLIPAPTPSATPAPVPNEFSSTQIWTDDSQPWRYVTGARVVAQGKLAWTIAQSRTKPDTIFPVALAAQGKRVTIARQGAAITATTDKTPLLIVTADTITILTDDAGTLRAHQYRATSMGLTAPTSSSLKGATIDQVQWAGGDIVVPGTPTQAGAYLTPNGWKQYPATSGIVTLGSRNQGTSRAAMNVRLGSSEITLDAKTTQLEANARTWEAATTPTGLVLTSHTPAGDRCQWITWAAQQGPSISCHGHLTPAISDPSNHRAAVGSVITTTGTNTLTPVPEGFRITALDTTTAYLTDTSNQPYQATLDKHGALSQPARTTLTTQLVTTRGGWFHDGHQLIYSSRV